MRWKKLQCSRYIENFNPPSLIEKLVHKVCESVADAFLGQIEYGKDYIINTELVKDDWADGFGTKYTYTLGFDELVRCGDCKYYLHSNEKCELLDTRLHFYATYNIWTEECFCAWGERRDA